MSAVLKAEEFTAAGVMREEDLLYMDLATATERANDLIRMTRLSKAWIDAHREYELSLQSARERAKKLRDIYYAWSAVIDELMRAHGV